MQHIYADLPTNAVQYKPAECCDKKVDCYNAVMQSDHILKTDWHEFLTQTNENSAYIDKFFNMLTQFENMGDGHLDSIEA